MTFKKLTRKIHLWLGLASSPVIILLGVTGCLLAFQREIENATQVDICCLLRSVYIRRAASKKVFMEDIRMLIVLIR